jgi:UDP-N-acetylmuramoyl-L-alanyl-D-glutamate--2,6-diaminopimelate ligase
MRAALKKLIPKALFEAVEPYFHSLEAFLAQVRYGYPAKIMKVIGVTGSAGKTTTTTLMASVLRAAGYKTAFFTTVNIDIGEGTEFNDTRMTTMPPRLLAKYLLKAKMNGVEWVVIETSSHSLQQGRVLGMPFEAAILTNISHEHLDYHKTMERYVAAKRRLFEMVNANKMGAQLGVVNGDDAHVKDFTSAVDHPFTFGLGASADVRATEVVSSVEGSSFHVVSKEQDFPVTVHIPGSFNVMNALSVAATALSLGIAPKAIQEGLANLDAVEGRMARYKTDKGFTVIIDFAHTPDAFEKIFKEFRPLTKGKMTALFGRAGERDVESRYIQGTLAADYCERIVLTEDDPRSEKNEDIVAQIQEGIEKSTKKPEVIVELDRKKAIYEAVRLAEKGDTILLLSKGHERSILEANGPKPWSEVDALKDALKTQGIKLV